MLALTRAVFLIFLGRLYGADLTYDDRPPLFCIRHILLNLSLDLSHGQPAKVCGEAIVHRDIRDHMEHLSVPLRRTHRFLSVAELSLAKNDTSFHSSL